MRSRSSSDTRFSTHARTGIGGGFPHGFSLLELLAAIVIVATLAAVATPLYQKHAQQMRYLDGRTRLLEIMDFEQRHYARTWKYTDALEELGPTSESEPVSAYGHYRISARRCEGEPGECIVLIASPNRDGDDILTLDSRGRRTPAAAWR